MSKINSGLYLLLGVLIASIGFSVYMGPVLADSTTATIIGGATNGNIFGSIQYDEMNITSAGVWRSDSGAGPIFLNVTYPTGLAWNNTWIHTSMSLSSPIILNNISILNNVGDANPVIAITADAVNPAIRFGQGGGSVYDVYLSQPIGTVREIHHIPMSDNTAFVIYGTASQTNYNRLVFEVKATGAFINMAVGGSITQQPMVFQSGGTEVFRITNTKTISILKPTHHNNLVVSGVQSLYFANAGTSNLTYAQLTQVAVNTISVMTPNAANNAAIERIRVGGLAAQGSSVITFYEPTDFNGVAVTNVGSATNDFGATNVLAQTQFNGNLDLQGNLIDNVRSAKSGANPFDIITNNGAAADTTRINVETTVNIARIQVSNAAFNVGTGTHATPIAGDLRMSGTDLLFYNGTGWRTVTSTP